MCKNRFSKIFKKNVARVKLTRVVQGGPGGSRGSPGGALDAPGVPFGGPGGPLRIGVATLEGPWGVLGASKNCPGAFF